MNFTAESNAQNGKPALSFAYFFFNFIYFLYDVLFISEKDLLTFIQAALCGLLFKTYNAIFPSCRFSLCWLMERPCWGNGTTK